MFDGKTLDGWEAIENSHVWTVQDECIVGRDSLGTGDGLLLSHLFYTREQHTDCEFRAEIKLNHGGNSGVYFRARRMPGFPDGYEAQVNNSHVDPRRTGSLYGFVDITAQLVRDNHWWSQHIITRGNHIRILIDGIEVVNFVDAHHTYTSGYFALQYVQRGSVVLFRNLMMRGLTGPPEPQSGK